MNVDFSKHASGLVPAIVQDPGTGNVLMLGYMNEEAFTATKATGRVTFFSRSKDRIWVKGETSGNYIDVESICVDCDFDTILILGKPRGPVCHTGARTCFGDTVAGSANLAFLDVLSSTIRTRRKEAKEGSYVGRLFSSGLNSIIQKVGEEAVEVIISAKDDDTESFKGEAADLLFHLLVLLEAKNTSLTEVAAVLANRHALAIKK